VLANVYRANFFLRKFGIHPSPPGSGPVRDTFKKVTFGGLVKTRQLLDKNCPW